MLLGFANRAFPSKILVLMVCGQLLRLETPWVSRCRVASMSIVVFFTEGQRFLTLPPNQICIRFTCPHCLQMYIGIGYTSECLRTCTCLDDSDVGRLMHKSVYQRLACVHTRRHHQQSQYPWAARGGPLQLQVPRRPASLVRPLLHERHK